MAATALPRSRASRTARACPAGTRRPTSTRTPRASRTRRSSPVPAELRAEIEAHMARYPDRHSAALPALAAAQRLHGWCSPQAIDQVACVMRRDARLPDLGRDLLRHVRAPRRRCRSAPRGLRLHEHLLLAARRRAILRATLEAAAGDPATQPAPLRVPRRLRHRADGLGRRRLLRAARRRADVEEILRPCARSAPCCPTSSSRPPCADPAAAEGRRARARATPRSQGP